MKTADYQTLWGLPELAGLCTMQQAAQAEWSVDESVRRLKRIHYVVRRICEAMCERIPGEPIYELKMGLSHHTYLCSEQVTAIRRRVSEMREPPLGLDKVPCLALERMLDEVSAVPSTLDFFTACYGVILPDVSAAFQRLVSDAHPLADAPTVRLAKLAHFELADVLQFGTRAIDCLARHASTLSTQDTPTVEHNAAQHWQQMLVECLQAAGGVDGCAGPEADVAELPKRIYSPGTAYHPSPRRDARFVDPYNAGVNPEAFLYDKRFSAQDKTLMMYYKRIREIDVPEMMAGILVELRHEEPWEFHAEMLRQLWDEARHAMMGEVGFASLGIDWTEIPINFTWSKNLAEQLTARQRHGVLFFIEQGLMPRTGKRYEWEVGMASGDSIAGLFQDFDWADEVLHAQIGRRWYVPKFDSLRQALEYGDTSWSQVLSHWRQYQDAGLTEHYNWWPDLYRQACQRWGKTPDPEALNFAVTYEDQRADLKEISRPDDSTI